MAPPVSIAVQPGATARRRFVVAQTPQGDWCTRDRQGQILRVFATQREAIHFALFETGTDRAAVLLTPA
ncbi:MAG TPA: hypothetical protein VHT04_16530 [Stellaceae bacterium]|jgi:hypothetical protein|nr:hypothetical protein [Stellaceae bacterium]